MAVAHIATSAGEALAPAVRSMPRQLITESDDQADASDLPELTAQQQEFVRLLLAGKTASDAYRASYDASRMSKNAVWVEASRLRSHPNVALWLAAARKACLGTAALTLDAHLQELERLRELAIEKGNLGAAVQAEQIRGKVKGYHVDQVRDVTDRSNPHRALDSIAAKMGYDVALAAAAKYGITDWKPQSETRH